jgi:hypothetical protein
MELTARAIICPLNSDVDRINRALTERQIAHGRPQQTYLSAHVADYNLLDARTQEYAVASLQYFRDPNLPDHDLQLFVGCPVMCMKNISVEEGVCNGTIMVVEELRENVVICRVRNRYGREARVPFHPVQFDYDERARGGQKFTRYQLPLRRSFAVTNHRSQGGTYDVVGFHALNIFECFGSTYVAVSRCRAQAGLLILCEAPREEGELPRIKNYVHPMVIREYAPRAAGPRHRRWTHDSDVDSDHSEPPLRLHGDEPEVEGDPELDEQVAQIYGDYDSDAESDVDSFFTRDSERERRAALEASSSSSEAGSDDEPPPPAAVIVNADSSSSSSSEGDANDGSVASQAAPPQQQQNPLHQSRRLYPIVEENEELEQPMGSQDVVSANSLSTLKTSASLDDLVASPSYARVVSSLIMKDEEPPQSSFNGGNGNIQCNHH